MSNLTQFDDLTGRYYRIRIGGRVWRDPDEPALTDADLAGEPLTEPPAPEQCGACGLPVTICECGGDVAEFDDGPFGLEAA